MPQRYRNNNIKTSTLAEMWLSQGVSSRRRYFFFCFSFFTSYGLMKFLLSHFIHIIYTQQHRNPIQIWFDILSSFGDFSRLAFKLSTNSNSRTMCDTRLWKCQKCLNFILEQSEIRIIEIKTSLLSPSLLNIFFMGEFLINKMNELVGWEYEMFEAYFQLANISPRFLWYE